MCECLWRVGVSGAHAVQEEAARVKERLSVFRAGQDSDEEAEPSSEDEDDGAADLKSWGPKRQYYVQEGVRVLTVLCVLGSTFMC